MYKIDKQQVINKKIDKQQATIHYSISQYLVITSNEK